MKHIKIRNFGPLRNVDIDLSQINRNRLFLHIVYKEVDITFAAEQKTVANGK